MAAAWGPPEDLDAATSESAVGDDEYFRSSDSKLAFQISGSLARNALLASPGLLIDGAPYAAVVAPLSSSVALKRTTVSGASGTVSSISAPSAGLLRFTVTGVGDIAVGQSVRFDGVMQGVHPRGCGESRSHSRR